MSDDLETRLGRALQRHAEGATAVPRPRPAVASVLASARRRRLRQRLTAGGLAVTALLALAVARPALTDEPTVVEVATDGPTPAPPTSSRPPATTTTTATTTTVLAAPTAPDTPSYSSPTAVTTPTYQPLAWYDLVDGVQVAWQTDGEVTTTWTRVDGGPPQAVGVERAEPQAHVVPTGDHSLLIVVFAAADAVLPKEVTVDADGIAPSWTELTWDPAASVGWARPVWTSPEPPAEDLAVAQR